MKNTDLQIQSLQFQAKIVVNNDDVALQLLEAYIKYKLEEFDLLEDAVDSIVKETNDTIGELEGSDCVPCVFTAEHFADKLRQFADEIDLLGSK